MELKSCLKVHNFIFLLFVIFVIFLLFKMTDIALLLFCSYVISCSINPIVDKMEKKIPRSLAVFLMILLITLVTLGVFIPIIVMSINEIKDFLTQLPQQISSIQSFLSTFKIGSQNLTSFVNIETVLDNSTTIAKEVIDKSINLTIGFLGVLTILVTLGIIVFFLSNDKKEIKEYSLKLFPHKIRDRASEVIDELETKVGGYVTAQLLSISIVGLIVAIFLAVMGVEYSVLLGFISAILDLVPIVGPLLAGVLILLIAYPHGLWVAVIAVFSLLLGQFVENNWAKPYFFSKYMDLHPLVVIFSFVIAAKFLGFVGVLISPAIAAVLVTLFDELYIKTMNGNENCDDE